VTSFEAFDRATAPMPWTLRAIYTAIGLSTASIAPFIPVILKERGLDPATIGLVAALGALASTVVVPAWGHLADALVGRARAFRIGVLIAAGTAAGLLLDLPLVAVAGMFASFTVFASLFIGLADALAVVDLPAPERQYGALRAHASLSFTVGVVAVGFLYSWAGYGAAPGAFLVWAAALLLLVGRIPDRPADAKARTSAGTAAGNRGRRFGSPGRAFAVQPRLGILLVIFALAFAGLQGALTFIGIRIVELGGQPSDVAISFGVAAIAEIPGLVAAGWLGRRLGLRWLFVLSLILYGVCITSWGILSYALAINATRAVTGLCNGSLMAARVLMVPRLLPRSLQATGQVLFQAATLGFGTVMGSVVGGMVYGSFGPTVFFSAAGGVAIAGAVGAWFVMAGPVGGRLTGRTIDPFELAELPPL
jgi:PPP family 3-phenylpropionic acid transporter